MDAMETRVENVENKVRSLELILDGIHDQNERLTQMHQDLLQSMLNHTEHLNNHERHLRNHDEHLRNHEEHLRNNDRRIREHAEHMKDHDILIAKQENQLEEGKQRLASMERFNLQTRRMWVSMARKMDLDYDDPDLDS